MNQAELKSAYKKIIIKYPLGTKIQDMGSDDIKEWRRLEELTVELHVHLEQPCD